MARYPAVYTNIGHIYKNRANAHAILQGVYTCSPEL